MEVPVVERVGGGWKMVKNETVVGMVVGFREVRTKDGVELVEEEKVVGDGSFGRFKMHRFKMHSMVAIVSYFVFLVELLLLFQYVRYNVVSGAENLAWFSLILMTVFVMNVAGSKKVTLVMELMKEMKKEAKR
jgi:uncharacterized membrane protein (GlpM family)